MIEARFKISRRDFTLDADVAIESKGVTALFGPSGSGKTTFLRTIAGLEKHSGCKLYVDGDIWQDGATFVPPHRRKIGYVFQEPSLFRHLDVRGNIEFGLRRIREADRNLSLEEAVGILGLDRLLDRRPEQLSGGERQRVAIARALASSPRILLMDEPLSSLDEGLKSEILPYIERLHRRLELPIIYVSHSTDEVARIADRLVYLENGIVRADGPVAEAMTDLTLGLALRDDAESIIQAVASGYDEEFGLALLAFPGGTFAVPGPPVEKDRRIRLRLAARDVSLTLERQQGTSILNIFPAKVKEIADSGEFQVTVLLDIAGTPVLARVTRRSASALGLAPGAGIYAQAKSVAVIS